MTEYRISCKDCTNKAVNLDGEFYCLPAIRGKITVRLEDGHDGTRKDPDVILCDHFTTEPQQLALWETEAQEIFTDYVRGENTND